MTRPAIGRPPARAGVAECDGRDILAALARMKRRAASPAVVVPIHNAPAALARCVAALLAHTPFPRRIVLIDDASSDAAVAPLLARARAAGLEIVRNERNLGFTQTANRGLALAGDSDVVLLNSDTEVTPRWLTNLRLAAYSGDRVGTATALADNAGAFSAPLFGKVNALPAGMTIADAARLVMRTSARAYPAVPTGGGFCMYVRRDCLDEVGGFDADAFPRGYGEENDFCMRARAGGWSHVVDDATYIHHDREGSFGAEKEALLRAGLAVLRARYPDYARLAGRLGKDPALSAARRRVATALAGTDRVKPRRLVLPGTSRRAEADDASEEIFVLVERPGTIDLIGAGAAVLASASLRGEGSTEQGFEALFAGWLVTFAVETVRIAGDAPHAGTVAGLAADLGIPILAA